MIEELRQLVWSRAGDTCEYCYLHQRLDILPFQIDHVIASKHRQSGQSRRIDARLTIAKRFATQSHYPLLVLGLQQRHKRPFQSYIKPFDVTH